MNILKEPKELLEISIPLRFSDGPIQIFKGWRYHYNNALGPYKGNIRAFGHKIFDYLKSVVAKSD